MGDDHARHVVHRHRRDAHVAAADVGQHVGQGLILRYARYQHHPVQFLLLHEPAHAIDVVRAAAVAGVHHQFEARIAHRIQRAVLQVDDVLRGRVVIDHAHQERLAEGQAARHRVGRVTHFPHQSFDLLARVLTHQRRVVDDARDGLLGNARQPCDVVDRGSLAGSNGRCGRFGRLARRHRVVVWIK